MGSVLSRAVSAAESGARVLREVCDVYPHRSRAAALSASQRGCL